MARDVENRLPFALTQYVEVTFPSTANTDLVIPHTLNPADPEAVRFLVVSQEAAGHVYRDASASRRAWGTAYVILRSDIASLGARLLLFTERP